MIEQVGLDIDGEVILLNDDDRDEGEDDTVSGASSTYGSYRSSGEDSTDCDSDDSASSSYLDSSDEESLLEALAGMDLTGQTTTETLRRCWSADAIADQEYSAVQVSALLNQIRNSNDLKPSPMMSVAHAGHKPFGIQSKHTKARRRLSVPPSIGRAPVTEQKDEVIDMNSMSPMTVLSEILMERGESFPELLCSDVDNYFVPITEDRIKSYTKEIVTAIRNEDIDSLRRLYFDEKANLDCCNKFGESVLHMACRQNLPRVVDFLIHEAKVDLRVRDDYGRTPMHDACWAPDFNKKLLHLLVTEWPDLLFVKDKRGSTPLSYIRKAQWGDWHTFLNEHKELLRPKLLSSTNPAEDSGLTQASMSAVSA